MTAFLSTDGGETLTVNEPAPVRFSSTPKTKPVAPEADEIVFVCEV